MPHRMSSSGRSLRARRLRSALYLATNGHCAGCGAPLASGWHADHVTPWSRTRHTNVHEMQALCPTCNLRKGTTMEVMMSEEPTVPVLSLRPFQQAFLRAALAKAEAPRTTDPADRAVIADIHPGSGKTRAYLHAADALYRRGLIDAVVVFTPRLNLARQAETDWATLRSTLPPGGLGPICQRDNVPPLLRDGADGYTTTYQSLLANPDLHRHFVRRQPTLVVFDEAQQLGDDSAWGQGTRSADLARHLGAHARLIFVLSGTPYRADGQPLLFARYGPPDAEGRRLLVPDVQAAYLDGVRQGYLREFECHLHDGIGHWQPGAGTVETLTLSQLERGLARVLRQPGYWQPLVDRFVAKVREVQDAVDPCLRGLIAATDQEHARTVISYLRRVHGNLQVLLATQDESQAQDNLRRFRRGEGDVLVTVAMAHVGYDCPAISVVLPLTTTRQEGWLRQLVARGLRMLPTLDRELQVCHAIVPDDARMAAFVAQLRGESVAGLRQREEREARETGDGASAGADASAADPAASAPLGIGLGATLTTVRAQGLDPRGDADPRQLAVIEAWRQRLQIHPAVPATKLLLLVQACGGTVVVDQAELAPLVSAAPDQRALPPGATVREREQALRQACHKTASRCDWAMQRRDSHWKRGDTHRRAKEHFGTRSTACGEAALRERLQWLLAFYQAAVHGEPARQEDPDATPR